MTINLREIKRPHTVPLNNVLLAVNGRKAIITTLRVSLFDAVQFIVIKLWLFRVKTETRQRTRLNTDDRAANVSTQERLNQPRSRIQIQVRCFREIELIGCVFFHLWCVQGPYIAYK